MKNKFLLTGSRGFLGGIVKDKLITVGEIKDINDLADRRIDIKLPFELPESFVPDVVIHIAGKAHVVPRTATEEKEFYEVNYEGTKNLCKALENLVLSLKGLVFISTVAVYGVENGQNINEEHALEGNSPYAKSKIMAEEYIRDWGKNHNVPVLILRLPLLAGPNPPGNLGKMIAGIRSGKYFSINKGKARRSVIMAQDVAKCISDNIGKDGTYNLTDGYHPSFGEIEGLISRQMNKSRPYAMPGFLAKLLGIAGDILPKFPINSDTISKMSNDLTFDDSKAKKHLIYNPERIIDVFKID